MQKKRLTFWWYLLRNWNFLLIFFHRRKHSLLMIPIEELKLRTVHHVCAAGWTFDDTYWGIETVYVVDFVETQKRFWWYLLRNWNCLWFPVFSLAVFFWWYLLRNWNRDFPHNLSARSLLLMIPIEELKHGFEKFGVQVFHLLMIPIEELKPWWLLRLTAQTMLLMIPIEELKRRNGNNVSVSCSAFDDTYWGIETATTWLCISSGQLLMIPIEELKLMPWARR